ncbi:uncharacterized protein isoform X2 [Leptinotarsa decemlineata]|uniref:uncharacterized protein isoform X2 n=1 Tax=Leptinotarsa decemlineata TaxID=7539 RepID=UPI003D304FAE
MASPSKRLRLSPRSSQSLRTTQDTQDSKITSTPIRSSGNFHSPDISSISSSRTVRTRLSDVFEAEDNREVFESSSISAKEKDARSLTPATTVSEVSYIPVEEDYDAYFNNLGRIKYVGTVWKLYKPVNEHSLYHKILDDPLSIQEIVTKLFLKFNVKPEKVVHSLIQLCLDVANFQNFDVTKYYKFRENSEKEIIALLETDEVIDDHETLKSSGRYLFMESRSSLVKTMKMAIYNFFKKLILASYDNNVLFNKFFSKNLFNFIKCMSFSNMMVLRHTGVIIAMKILTALVIIYNNIIHRLNNSSSSGSVESEKIDRESQRKVFNSLIEYFYFIVIKNCRLQENRLLLMRIECIHEFQVWVKYFPKIFISELQVCTCLNRLIIDSPNDCSKQLVVESFLNCCSEMQNWQLYLKLLLGKEIQDLKMREALAEMLAEAIHQILIGKSTKQRTFSREVVDIDSTEHQKVAKLFPTFNKLLQIYGEHPTVLNQLLKIFPLVNTNHISGKLCVECTDLFSTMTILFGYHSDEGLLKKLAETMYHFGTIAAIRERIKQATEILCTKHVDELQAFLSNPTKHVCKASLRVAVLFSHFNLTENFTWEILCDCWADVNEKAIANLMICCKWFLIWHLRNLWDMAQKHQTKELSNMFTPLLHKCNEFTSSCINMIQHLRGEKLHFQVYETLCEFYILYSKELETPMKFNKQFENLILRIEDAQIQKSLTNFLHERVLSNREMELVERRENVVRYIDMVHCNILPIEALANIFKFYHANYNDYGSIIESSLSSMLQADDENTIYLVIVYTLTVVYEEIVRKLSVVDINTDEAKHLKLLVKQFIAFSHFRSTKKQFKKLLYFSIKYALKEEMKYAFLYFVGYFIDLLNDIDDRKEVFEFFKQKIPSGAEKNDAVLYFGNCFKKVSATKTPKPPKKVGNKKSKENEKPKKGTPEGKQGRNKTDDKVSKKRSAPLKSSTPLAHKRGASNRSNKFKKRAVTETETEISDDNISIHDDSDDMDISVSGIKL